MTEIFERFIQAEWDKDWAWTKEHHGPDASASQMPRTNQQRRFDALAAIFEASVSTVPGAQPPEPVVNIITDPDTFAETLAKYFGITPQPGPSARSTFTRCCHTTDGVPIAPNEMLAAVLTGHIRRVILDSASVVIDMGRKQRLFTGNARIAAHMTNPRCIWVGCELPATRCHTDHLTDWQHGGHTRPHDGAPCCPRHNYLKNRGYTITRDHQGRYHTHRPNGTEIN